MKANFLGTIKEHIDNKSLLRVDRSDAIDGESIIGFPVCLSDTLLLMSNVVDLHDEGYIIVRLSDITDAYLLESDSFYERMCSGEGLKANAFDQNTLKDVEDLESVLNQLAGYPGFVSISCDLLDNELCFSIGKIAKIENGMVRFNHFDAEGIWEDTERLIPIAQITSISFGDNYSKIYFKYMKAV